MFAHVQVISDVVNKANLTDKAQAAQEIIKTLKEPAPLAPSNLPSISVATTSQAPAPAPVPVPAPAPAPKAPKYSGN
jgi:hypothetical protein